MPQKHKDKPASPAKPKDLRKFLQREIIREQLKIPSDDLKRGNGNQPLSSLFMSTPEEDQNDSLLNQSASYRDVDSVFGEEILTHEEIRKARLERFLVETKAQETKVKSNTKGEDISDKEYENESSRIEELKAELRELAVLEMRATPRERSLIMRQKEALRAEVSSHDHEEMRKKVPKRGLSRNELNEEIRQMPPPLSYWDMKVLERNRKREEKNAEEFARALKEENQEIQLSKTPKRKRDLLEVDLDGEELLKMHGEKIFKKPRKQPTPTGRWRSVIHDYFPESEQEMQTEHIFRDMCKEDRMVFRRELADVGERMAKAHRAKRRADLVWDCDSLFGGEL